jgi:hypothetical protein
MPDSEVEPARTPKAAMSAKNAAKQDGKHLSQNSDMEFLSLSTRHSPARSSVLSKPRTLSAAWLAKAEPDVVIAVGETQPLAPSP